MNNQQRAAFVVLPFTLTLVCACVLIIALVGTRLTPVTAPTRAAVERPTPVPVSEEAHAAGDSQIQILGSEFDEAQIAEGEAIYTQFCSACHGADGQGQFPEAPLEPDITGRIGAPPHNETGHSWHHSDVLLIRYVTEGGFSDLARYYLMPPFGDILTNEQILSVIAFIKTMWTDEQRASQRQLTEDEQSLFSD